MSEIDLKFMKGDRALAKAIGNKYGKKPPATKKKTVKKTKKK